MSSTRNELENQIKIEQDAVRQYKPRIGPLVLEGRIQEAQQYAYDVLNMEVKIAQLRLALFQTK